jgi:putative ABC transport system permease protein
MQALLQDLRFGSRMLFKRPGFTLTAVLTLALGIGANTAIFTIVNAVLLRPMPYPESERLVEIGRAFDDKAAGALNEPKFVFLRDNARSFEAIAGNMGGSDLYLSDGNEAEYVGQLRVTADFFRMLGVAPAIGRGFTAEEDSPAGGRVAILGGELWRRRFGADVGVLGRTISLNGAAYTIVGVMPPGFKYAGQQDVILPMRVNPAGGEKGYNWTVLGRLKQGVTLDQARAEALALLDNFESSSPDRDEKGKVEHRLMLWRSSMTADVQTLLWILFGAVSFVLLIACANVANLQLTRAAGRGKEVAVRMALGAGGWRVVRQLLTEGIMLALIGGGAGLLLAVWGMDGMIALVPKDMIPRVEEINVDWRVLLFALGGSILTGVISGLAPALQTLRVDVIRNLKEGAGKTGADVARGRLRGVLVVVEVALALTLAVGAGLLLRTFANLLGVEKGFDERNTLTFYISPRGEKYNSVANTNDLYRRALDRLRSLPGVEAAALTNQLPLNRWFNMPYMMRAGQTNPSGAAEYRLISNDYFNVMRMSLRRGRQFNGADVVGAEPVIIINEAFARRNFANAEPLGRQVYVCCDERGDVAMRRVVGVVNDTKQRSLSGPAPQTVFIPVEQATEGMKEQTRYADFTLRATGDPLALSAAVRGEMRQLDPAAPVRGMRSMEQVVGRSVAPHRFHVSLLGLLAALGLVLAAVGIYGVMAYSVSQRKHEIGLRMALGAQGRDVMKIVVGQGMTLAATGVAIGLIASYALTRFLNAMLFGVSATDPLTFTVIALSLGLVALLACWIPARRAAKVDPMIALRCE